MLTLPIKKKWFDMIASGEKPDEYRDLTPYYAVRFANVPKFQADGKTCCHVLLRAGYRHDSPILAIRCWIDKGKGRKEWGAEPGKEYFRLHIVWVSHYLNACNIRLLQGWTPHLIRPSGAPSPGGKADGAARAGKKEEAE